MTIYDLWCDLVYRYTILDILGFIFLCCVVVAVFRGLFELYKITVTFFKEDKRANYVIFGIIIVGLSFVDAIQNNHFQFDVFLISIPVFFACFLPAWLTMKWLDSRTDKGTQTIAWLLVACIFLLIWYKFGNSALPSLLGLLACLSPLWIHAWIKKTPTRKKLNITDNLYYEHTQDMRHMTMRPQTI